MFASAGYRQGFADQGGMAPVFGLQMATPRIEVAGSDRIEDFAAKIGMQDFPPSAADAV